MPRMPENNYPYTPVSDRDKVVSTTIRPINGGKKEPHRGNSTVYIQNTDTELKLQILAESITKDFLPLDFNKQPNIKEATISDLADTAYIFIDNNGKPIKILAPSVLRTAISWDDLAADAKQHIQAAIDAIILHPGENITINSNVISANIGVKTVNGRTDDVVLTANDLNAYTKNETFSRTEVENIINSLEVIVDGGRIE